MPQPNQAYLPPGVSRHIIHGRALKLNYPMNKLRADLPLEEKNQHLQQWIREETRKPQCSLLCRINLPI